METKYTRSITHNTIQELLAYEQSLAEQEQAVSAELQRLNAELELKNNQVAELTEQVELSSNRITDLMRQLEDCRHTEPEPEPQPYHFAHDFQGVKIQNNTFEPWNTTMKQLNFYERQVLKIQDGNKCEITSDGRLITEIINCPSDKTRVAFDIDTADNAPEMDIVHCAVDMHLHADLAALSGTPSDTVQFYHLFEIWNDGQTASWNICIEKKPGDATPRFRWWGRIFTNGQIVGPLYERQFASEGVPFGQWITFEPYWNRNTGETWLKINGKKVIDFIGVNIDKRNPARRASYFSPVKHYVGLTAFNHLKGQGKKMEIQFGKFIWYKQ